MQKINYEFSNFSDQKFMHLAVAEAKKSSETIGCGVIIVKNGKIIAKAFNNQRKTHNASAHAEINAVKKAGQILKNKNLENCTIYCTTEPCIMCLAALSYAKISRLVFGLSMKETYQKDRILDLVSIDSFIKKSPHKFGYTKGVCKDECQKLLN